ncbi:MAG: hypothetical protein ACREDL_24485 [Bradyrhizobium sp.]
MRKRSTPHTFAPRSPEEKARLEAELKGTSPGGEHDLVVRKLQQIESATRLDRWMTSKELRPPK